MPENKSHSTLSRMVISLVVTLVIAAVWFYVSLPAINLHNTGFYSYVLVLLLVYILVFMIALGVDTGTQGMRLQTYLSFAKSQCKAVGVIVLALAAIFVVGQILSAPILRAGSYRDLLQVDTGDFATEIEQISFDEIPMLDESSARRLGDRKLGELSDMVSQFEVAYDYTQINYQGRPVRVASLEYGDFFKWFLNTKEGLPAYITIDMVTQEAKVVRLSSVGQGGMRYSPSEIFNRDLDRPFGSATPPICSPPPIWSWTRRGSPGGCAPGRPGPSVSSAAGTSWGPSFSTPAPGSTPITPWRRSPCGWTGCTPPPSSPSSMTTTGCTTPGSSIPFSARKTSPSPPTASTM